MHFSQSKSTKCEIFVWNCNFLGTTYHRDSKPAVLDLALPRTINTHHSSHFNAFFPVKINKMWNFCLKLWFFEEPLIAQTHETCGIGFGMHVKPLHMCYSSHFNAFVPVKINKMWNFMPEIVIFHEPLIVGTCNKCHWIWHASNPKYCTTQAISMHFPSQNQQNVKFFVWNCNFLGTTYHRDSKPAWYWIWHASNLKYAPLKPFQCVFPSQNQQNVKFLSEIVIFSGTADCTDSKHVALDLAYVKPYICATQAISMHLFPVKINKMWKFFVWNCNFLLTTYHRDSKPAVLDLAFLKP